MRQYFQRRARVTALAAAALGAAACSTDSLLEAPDPDLIEPVAIRSAAGAEGLRVGTLQRFRTALQSGTSASEGIILQAGLLADEWKTGNTFTETDEVDQRITTEVNGGIENTYTQLHRARVSAINTILALREYSPDSTRNIGQMYLVRGFMELSLAENFCSGVALSSAAGAEGLDDIEYGDRLTTPQLLNATIATLDTAISAASATDAATTNVRQAAQLLRARALLDLDRGADARTAAAAIPNTFVYRLTFLPNTGSNGIWSINTNQRRFTVGDSVNTGSGTVDRNVIPFARLNDPRVPVTRTGNSFDTNVPFARQNIWGARDSALAILQGLDARLIEAEVALNRGQSAAYLTILNDLRRTTANPFLPATPAYNLPALTDPGTPAARVQQFFREKALWQFSRGYRLNDLRRLVRQYGLAQENVFPAGPFLKGGEHGTAVNLTIPVEESNNEGLSGGYGCIDRNA